MVLFGFGACCASKHISQEEEVVTSTVPSTRCSMRTALDESIDAVTALEMLQKGNERFVGDVPETPVVQQQVGAHLRCALSTKGQNPAAIVIGCADSRCPVEILFDADPGDIFVLRNAGNTIEHAEGSMVGSVEYATGHLGTRLIVVLGHTLCGAIAGATKTMIAKKEVPKEEPTGEANNARPRRRPSLLDNMLAGLSPVAEQADGELPAGSSMEEISAHAIKVNVFRTMDKLMEYSKPIREKVRDGKVQVHGAIYDLESGKVEWLGQSPKTNEMMDSFPGAWDDN